MRFALLFVFFQAYRSDFALVFTTGCRNVNPNKTLFRWRCVDAGEGSYPSTLDFSPGCLQIQFDPVQNSTSGFGTGCKSRIDTLSLQQTAWPNETCKFKVSNGITLQSEERKLMISYEGCIEHFPFTIYDITPNPKAPFRGRYEFFSINECSFLNVSTWIFLLSLCFVSYYYI